MSNATDTPKKQGQRKRRRRGGRNRNTSSNTNSNQNSNRSQGAEGSSKNGGRPRRHQARRQPIKLSFWEKILVAIGLKEDPNKRKPKPKTGKKSEPGKAPKSNTRNARSKEGGDRPKADSTRKRANRDKGRKGGDPSTVKSARVYVGNLSFDVTEEDLKELFKGVGNVRGVEIVYNRNTHRSKGYGFVDMMNKDDAIRSVEVLHDQPFMGRNITVSGAKDKSESTDPDELEPPMEIKASDLELAPLPEKAQEEETPEAALESTGEAEAVAEAPAAPQVEVEAPAEASDDNEPEQAKQG